MVFSSLPVYHLDPPNWPLQQDPQQVGPGEINSQLPPLMPPPPPPPPPVGGVADAASIIRPGSMTERARLAKLPQPEASLKCPRCESTNTKFCYFNNYSLTQPRHFCKTCRRYWTRGGALRNVPVGGGCRRNKRSSKGRNRSKSPITSSDRQSSSTSTSAVSSNSCSTDHNNINLAGHHLLQLPLSTTHQPPSFFPHLHNLPPDFGSTDMGLSFGQVGTSEIDFQIGNTTSGVAAMGIGPLNLSARFADQWKLPPQFPFLSGLQQFDAGAVDQPFGYGDGATDPLEPKTITMLETSAGDDNSLKHEESSHQQGPNSSRNFLSHIPAAGNEQYWGGGANAWTDVSGSTSSATHLM